MTIDKEFQTLIPALMQEEYNQLEENLLQNGIREPLSVWGDILIDGHNRYDIAQKHDLPYTTKSYEFDSRNDVIFWIIKNQFGRRNISNYDRSLLALRLKPVIAEKARERMELGKKDPTHIYAEGETRQELGKMANVSHGTIAKVEAIEQKAIEPVREMARRGEITINQAEQASRMTHVQQEKILPKIQQGLTVEKAQSEIKKEEFKENIQRQKVEIESGVAVMPTGKFEVIVCDPPWSYGTSYDSGGRRVANPYPEMTQSQLMAMDVPAADDSVLFLWTTHKFIWDAKELLDTWGFEYRSILVWNKEQIGMGDLFRMQCEFCLVGIKGKPLLDNPHDLRDIISEQRREHSRKPEAFYDMVDKLCIGRKLDYFSRQERKGWVCFGNETIF